MRLSSRFCWWLLFLLACAPPLAAEGVVTAPPSLATCGGADGGKEGRAASRSDSIWMVSTRCLACGCASKPAEQDFRFLRYDPAGGCQEAAWDAWSSEEVAGTATVIYVHGNRIEAGEVLGRGWTAYRALLRAAPDAPPLRFVIWSWPSDKVHGPRPRRDAQVKAARTHCESYYLADFMSRLNPDTSLRLLGYSFGGRIVSGALHLTGGGTLGPFQLADANSRPPNSLRVVLLAPAMDNHWWLPGRYHGDCFSQVDQLLLLYNSCDPVLRFYSRLDRGRGAPALGYSGFCWTSRLGENAERLEQTNVCCQIGKTHDEDAYFASEANMRAVREILLAP
jgi:hypothetical protein